MPSAKILEAKKAYVAELNTKIAGSLAGVVVSYNGISVADDTKMRKELREAGVEYRVVKNTMLRLALKDTPYEEISNVLENTTALALSHEDPIIAAKIICKYIESSKSSYAVKAGFADGKPMDKAGVETLAKLRTINPGGFVTAGNASGINDGAAAIVVMSEEKAKELGVTPMATWVAGALGGVEPEIMGVGPVASTKKVLAKTGLSIDDFDLIEANEAFAAQSIAVARDLKFDMSKVNVNGGAIALGHPVGASGCRILVTLLHEMQKRDAKKGLATLCIGGGMGCSTIVERD